MIDSSIISFTIYIFVMLAIGIHFYKKTNDSADYILGGRKLGAFPTALSAVASDMSGWLLLGLPAFAMTGGMNAFWMSLGLFLGTYLNWQLVAKRLRIYTEIAGNALTIPQYFATRFGDKTGILRIVTSIAILFFFLFYTSSGLVAGGKLFNSVFGFDYTYAVVLSTIIVAIYTLVGGYLAVSWTDVIQGLLMLFCLLYTSPSPRDGLLSRMPSSA